MNSYCLTIWTGDVDKVSLWHEYLNFSDENLKLELEVHESTVEVCGKSLCFLDLKKMMSNQDQSFRKKEQTTI